MNKCKNSIYLWVIVLCFCWNSNQINFEQLTTFSNNTLNEQETRQHFEDVVQSYVSDFGFYSRAQRVGRTSFLGKNREHSLPLITGDGFRMMSDLFIDEPSNDHSDKASLFEWESKTSCESAGQSLNLNKGQAFLLFIRNYLVRPFFASGCFERITVPVVLITHNGDEDQPSDENAPYLDHLNLIHWFAQNCDRVHEKLTCIPIGIENRQWGPPSNEGTHGSMPELLLGMMASRMPAYTSRELALMARKDKTYQHTWAYFPRKTHNSRNDLTSILETSTPHWIRTSGAPDGGKYFVTDFYRNVLQHVAIVCPRGNGLDSHRAWESLYLGRVIITLHSSADKLWDGLPVVLLDSWDELPTHENEILDAAVKFATLTNTLDFHKLFIPYWICLIGSAANRSSNFCGRDAILQVLKSRVVDGSTFD